jgi:hypothetical protein
MLSNEAEDIFPDPSYGVKVRTITIPAGAKDKKSKRGIGKMMLRMEDEK